MGGFTRRPKVTPKVAEAFTDLADNSNVKLSPEDTPGTQAYSDAKAKSAALRARKAGGQRSLLGGGRSSGAAETQTKLGAG
jgi:hypothetical protein